MYDQEIICINRFRVKSNLTKIKNFKWHPKNKTTTKYWQKQLVQDVTLYYIPEWQKSRYGIHFQCVTGLTIRINV